MPTEPELAESLRKKGELLHLMGYPKEARIYEKVSKGSIMVQEGQFILDVSPEEYETAGSKFARAGLRLSELGMPEWKTVGQSIRFPFIIVEEGPDNMKDGELFAGVGKAALWKLKEILKAASVAITKTADNKIDLKPALNACVGKQVKVLYTEEVDTRPVSEGGTGTRYTKASAAYPPETTDESLGI